MKDRDSGNFARHSRDDFSATSEHRRLDGVYRQSGDGNLVMIRVRAPAGQWRSCDLDSIAGIADDSGDGRLHFTTRGDVELYGVPVVDLDKVLGLIRQAGLSSRGTCGDAVRNVVACAGSGICPKEKFDAAELARGISEEFAGSASFEHLPRKFKISVSGCGKACASPQIQDIGIVAGTPSSGNRGQVLCFDLYLAGGLGRNPMLARKVKRMHYSEDVLLFVRAALECFNELGERTRKQRARMKFLAETLGYDQLLQSIMKIMASKTWGHQI